MFRTKDRRNRLIVVPLDTGDLAVSLTATRGYAAEYEIARVARRGERGAFLIANDICPLTLRRVQKAVWRIDGQCRSRNPDWQPAGFGPGVDPRGLYRSR